MTQEAIVKELRFFQEKFSAPAVFGGLLDADGHLALEAVGVKRRGESDTVRLSDRIHIGSCCKMLTACLFGTFVSEHRASWEMPVTELFTDLADSIDDAWHQRSVAELFHCLSGMVANPPRRYLISGHTDVRSLPDQRTELVKLAFSKPPVSPGRFVYSNMSYIVMGAAIDRLSGASFESAFETRLLAPLGIRSAGYGPPPDVWGHSAKVALGNMALFKGRPADPTDSKSDNPPVLSSAGTLHLNCEDWARLLHLFQAQNQSVLVHPDIIQRILRRPENPAAPMTMGWAPVDLEGLSYVAQGSNMCWSATVLMDETRQRTALVVCNDGRTNVLRQSMQLARQLLNL